MQAVRVLLVLFCLVVLFQPCVHSHPISQSYWFVRADSDHLESELLIPLAEVASIPEIRSQLEAQPGKKLPELRSLLEEIILRSFVLRAPILTGEPQVAGFQIQSDGFLQVKLTHSFSAFPHDLEFGSTFHEETVHPHQTFCRVHGDSPLEFILDVQTPNRSVSYPESPILEEAQWWLLFISGVAFWFWLVLPAVFIVCLLLKSPATGSAVRVLDLFMVSQLAGFLLNPLLSIEFRPEFLQTGLALSLCYVALENMLIPPERSRVFSPVAFGLLFGASLVLAPTEIITAQLVISVVVVLLYLKSWLPLNDRTQAALWWVCFGLGVLFLGRGLMGPWSAGA